jgi:hypothetical protein
MERNLKGNFLLQEGQKASFIHVSVWPVQIQGECALDLPFCVFSDPGLRLLQDYSTPDWSNLAIPPSTSLAPASFLLASSRIIPQIGLASTLWSGTRSYEGKNKQSD